MESNYNELLPPVGDQEVGNKVFEILQEIIEDKQNLGLHKKWNRNYEMVVGKHWKQESNIPLVAANLCARHINQTVNQLTDNNPTFNISRVGDPNAPEGAHEDLQRAAAHWWVDQEQQDILESSVRGGETNGIAIEKVVFNAELEDGLGEVETVVVDPRHFGVYPVKWRDPKDLQKCLAVFHFYPMTCLEAKKKWPNAVIKADSALIKELDDERRNVNSQVGTKPQGMMVSLANVAKEVLNWGTKEDAASDELVIVEGWVRDNSTKKVVREEVVEAVGDIPTQMIFIEDELPVYPGGIRYVVACNGSTVLEDRPNPNINLDILPEEEARKTYLWDKYPFCAVNSVKDTVSGWGQSDIEQLEWLNMEMDKALSQLVLEKDRAVRRKYINPKDTGVPNDHFTNFMAILNPVDKEAGAGIRVLDYPAIPVDVQNAITLFKDLFFLISATFEVDQAQLGSNQLAYKSIAALIERVATMMRGKIRAYGRLIRERGRMYLSHVQNFYTEDRWINFEDQMGVQTSKAIRGTALIVPAKLTVVTGSTLPTSKVQQREEALALFNMGAIDQQELLSALEWSGRSNVIQRMKAGPVGAVINNFAQIGMPQDVLQFLQQVGQMEPKDLQKAIKAGEIPSFDQILKQLLQNASGAEPPMPPLEQADILVKQAEAQLKQAEAGKIAQEGEKLIAEAQKIQAEAQKLLAEAALAGERVNSEKAEQTVRYEGIKFDAAKLKMDQARTVAEITKAAKEQKTAVKKPKQASPTPAPMSTATPSGTITPTEKASPAGYNEVGMKSNNLEV